MLTEAAISGLFEGKDERIYNIQQQIKVLKE